MQCTSPALFRSALALLLVAFLVSGCSLFRRKNRCDDCPKWSLEQPAEAPPTAKAKPRS